MVFRHHGLSFAIKPQQIFEVNIMLFFLDMLIKSALQGKKNPVY